MGMASECVCVRVCVSVCVCMCVFTYAFEFTFKEEIERVEEHAFSGGHLEEMRMIELQKKATYQVSKERCHLLK